MAKRVFDIVASTALLLFLSPFLLIICILIKIESPGHPIFAQVRWGLDRKKINVYKFRTMFSNVCDAVGTIQTVSGDKRVTRIGKILRKSSIDELPQLFNVLKGDMSLVGPRCHPIGMLAAGILYEDLIPSYHVRHSMLPGITGLAQANGYRGPTISQDFAAKRIENDLKYIVEFNFILDLQIIFLTVVREAFGGRGS
ncbi:MAG: sugar transferase [Hyphomicrobiales bacterium]|nr:sugar transferase [Hyphomicrobiales bacterium]